MEIGGRGGNWAAIVPLTINIDSVDDELLDLGWWWGRINCLVLAVNYEPAGGNGKDEQSARNYISPSSASDLARTSYCLFILYSNQLLWFLPETVIHPVWFPDPCGSCKLFHSFPQLKQQSSSPAIMQKKVQVPTVGYFEVMVRDGRVATAFKGEPALPI